MGLDIKKNKEGLYKVKSSISDKQLGKEWMSEDELKKILIEKAYWTFITNVIEIDMEFPSDYYINNEREIIDEKHCAGKEFIIKNWNNGNIEKKYREICDRLKIELI